MTTIVISYRREDTLGTTGRIFDRLEDQYGQGHVFRDIDNIPFGTDFRRHLHETLDRCDILLVVVGPRWFGRNEAGQSRLFEEGDWVRIEVATALAKDIPVIPLLVEGAKMPKASELPEDLQSFAFRQAAVLDVGVDFRVHMGRLTKSMDRILAHKALEVEARAVREKQQQEQDEQEARAVREKQQRERAERDARAAREKQQQEEAEQEARAARERQQQEQAEREARAAFEKQQEDAERAQRAALEKQRREEAERAERTALEKQQQEQAEREAHAAREKQEKELLGPKKFEYLRFQIVSEFERKILLETDKAVEFFAKAALENDQRFKFVEVFPRFDGNQAEIDRFLRVGDKLDSVGGMQIRSIETFDRIFKGNVVELCDGKIQGSIPPNLTGFLCIYRKAVAICLRYKMHTYF